MLGMAPKYCIETSYIYVEFVRNIPSVLSCFGYNTDLDELRLYIERNVVINPVHLIHLHICNTVLLKNAILDRCGFIQSKRHKKKT